MAMFICNKCGNYVDNDYHPCSQDPNDELGLICPECAFEMEEEKETPLVRQKGIFTERQLAFIKKMEEENDDDCTASEE